MPNLKVLVVRPLCLSKPLQPKDITIWNQKSRKSDSVKTPLALGCLRCSSLIVSGLVMFSLPLHVLLQSTETLSNMAAIYYSPQGLIQTIFVVFLVFSECLYSISWWNSCSPSFTKLENFAGWSKSFKDTLADPKSHSKIKLQNCLGCRWDSLSEELTTFALAYVAPVDLSYSKRILGSSFERSTLEKLHDYFPPH